MWSRKCQRPHPEDVQASDCSEHFPVDNLQTPQGCRRAKGQNEGMTASEGSFTEFTLAGGRSDGDSARGNDRGRSDSQPWVVGNSESPSVG